MPIIDEKLREAIKEAKSRSSTKISDKDIMSLLKTEWGIKMRRYIVDHMYDPNWDPTQDHIIGLNGIIIIQAILDEELRKEVV